MLLKGYCIKIRFCNNPTIGSYNNSDLSPNGIPSGNQRWYGLVYLGYKWLVNSELIGKGHIRKKTALRPVASCSPRPSHVPGAYNVNSSSGCFRPGSLRPGATFFRPDAPGAPWRSLPSNHTLSAKPLPPAAPEGPVHLPPPPKTFRPRILSSQKRPVPSHDTPLRLNLSQTLPYPSLVLPYPADIFLPPSPSFPSAGRPLGILQHPPDVLLLLFFSPSAVHTLLVRRRLYRPPDVIPTA